MLIIQNLHRKTKIPDRRWKRTPTPDVVLYRRTFLLWIAPAVRPTTGAFPYPAPGADGPPSAGRHKKGGPVVRASVKNRPRRALFINLITHFQDTRISFEHEAISCWSLRCVGTRPYLDGAPS